MVYPFIGGYARFEHGLADETQLPEIMDVVSELLGSIL